MFGLNPFKMVQQTLASNIKTDKEVIDSKINSMLEASSIQQKQDDQHYFRNIQNVASSPVIKNMTAEETINKAVNIANKPSNANIYQNITNATSHITNICTLGIQIGLDVNNKKPKDAINNAIMGLETECRLIASKVDIKNPASVTQMKDFTQYCILALSAGAKNLRNINTITQKIIDPSSTSSIVNSIIL